MGNCPLTDQLPLLLLKSIGPRRPLIQISVLEVHADGHSQAAPQMGFPSMQPGQESFPSQSRVKNYHWCPEQDKVFYQFFFLLVSLWNL